MAYTQKFFTKDGETVISEDIAHERQLLWEGWAPIGEYDPYPVQGIGVLRYGDDPVPDRPIGFAGLLLWDGTANPVDKMGDRDIWLGP